MNGDDLKKARALMGMTQAELGRALDVDTMTVSRWERSAAPLTMLVRLALSAVVQSRINPSAIKAAANDTEW